MALSSDRTPDMSRVINELTKAIHLLNDKVDGLGGDRRPGSTAGGRAKPNDEAGKTQKELKELRETIKVTDKELDKLRKGVNDANRSFDHLTDAQNGAIKGLLNHTAISGRAQSKLIDKLHKSAAAGSALGKGMKDTAEKLAYLEKKLEESGHFLSEYTDALKEAGASTLDNIDDFDKLRKTIKQLDEELELSAEVKELIAKQEYKAAAALIDKEARDSNNLRKSMKNTTQGAHQLNRGMGALKTGVSKAADFLGMGFMKQAIQWGGAVTLITTGVKEVYSQFWQTASSGFGGAFIGLSKNAIRLGVDLAQLTQLAKENKMQVGKMGLDGFIDSLAASRVQLMQLGLTSAEAAKMRAVMNENARLTGTDIKNKGALNSSVQQQIDAFETLRAVTGESMEAVAEQTKAMINDLDSMKIMNSLNRQQRVLMLQNINAERVRLTTMGLSNEAAMGAIKAMQQMGNMKATDRIESGNKLIAAASALGMDPGKGERAAAIMRGGRAAMADPENQKFMTQFAKEMNEKQGALAGDQNNLSNQIIGNWTEDMSSSIAQLQDNMRGASLDRGLSKEEVEANKALGKVPALIAQSSAQIDSWVKMLQSPLLMIAGGVAGIAVLLTKHLLRPSPKKVTIEDIAPSGAGDIDIDRKKGKRKVAGTPINDASKTRHANGTPVQGSGEMGSRTSNQVERMAKEWGWTERDLPENKGYGGLNKKAEQIKADKAYAAEQATRAGRDKANATSIGSPELQRKMEQNRLEREQWEKKKALLEAARNNPPRRSILQRAKDVASTAVSGTRKVAGVAASAAGSAGGMVGGFASKALGTIGKLGMKAIPFVGWAIAGIEAIKGGFDSVKRAGEIFGVDTSKQALTTAQKVTAGIAGALNTISFGLIPTDSTAQFMHMVATEGVDIVKGFVSDTLEYMVNNAIPAIYNGLKTAVGWLGSAIMSVINGDLWDAVFVGEGGKGGIAASIADSIGSSVLFMGTAVLKGLMRVGADLLESVSKYLPDWMKGEGFNDMIKNWKAYSSEDTKVAQFDSPKQAEERKKEEAKKAEKEKAKAPEKVQGTTTETPKDNLGLVSDFGQALTEEQLAAQGIQAKPAQTNAPTVGTSGSSSKDSSGGTVVNNTTNNTTQTPPKTESETLLAGILGKVSELVELTDKGLKIADANFKGSVQQRLGTGIPAGYSPSIAEFMNMPI